MYLVVMLVCSAAQSPVECQRATAREVIIGPQVAAIGECSLVGQTTMAATSLLERGAGEYLKIRCEPVRPVASRM